MHRNHARKPGDPRTPPATPSPGGRLPTYPLPVGTGPYETSRGNACSFPTVPPAHILMRPGAPSTSFAALVPARVHLGFGRPVRLVRLRPGGSPQTLRTPPRGGCSVLRHRHRHWSERSDWRRQPLASERTSRAFPTRRPFHRRRRSSPPHSVPSPIRCHDARRGITPAFGFRPRSENGLAGLAPAWNMRRPAHTTTPADCLVAARSTGSASSWPRPARVLLTTLQASLNAADRLVPPGADEPADGEVRHGAACPGRST
jgi:hypothetical protein